MNSVNKVFRLPLDGSLDLTYRCNNNCRHCWLRLPPDSFVHRSSFIVHRSPVSELSFGEIRRIVDEARALGCRTWSISGGEPMLRPDFPEIWGYVTSHSAFCTLNTNGTLITPTVARLLAGPPAGSRAGKSVKMVSLYGATADVHDHITRTPGSFESAMRGFAYLKEAGVGFAVQFVPMRDNYHQIGEMRKLALSLSPRYRFGASWLNLSACRADSRNREIVRQRLTPKEILAADAPDFSADDETDDGRRTTDDGRRTTDDRLYAACITNGQRFHVDPYGKMSFCAFVKDPDLRFDLRTGTFGQAWDEFIPSLANLVRGGDEYRENCGSCERRTSCQWCPVYAYLEKGRHSARVPYLCEMTEENLKLKKRWEAAHRRYYRIGGMTIRVDADLPISDETFHDDLRPFETKQPGSDLITIRHHFSPPEGMQKENLGREAYRRGPWTIYRRGQSWIYTGGGLAGLIAVFSHDHTRARVYNVKDDFFLRGGLHALTSFPSDQILLARLLADRQGCIFHSAGLVLNGQGLLFIGHSEAGKSTTITMLQEEAKILCDDRIIVRRWPDGFRIHGTWAHGTVPTVSPDDAPLRALFIIEKAGTNEAVRITPAQVARKLPEFIIKGMATPDWWNKVFDLVGTIAREVPAYVLRLDKSGQAVQVVKDVLKSEK